MTGCTVIERDGTVCGEPVFVSKRQMCSAHYHRWQRYADPLGGTPRRNVPSTCLVVENDRVCGAPVLVKKRGLCAPHYQRWQRWGDPLGGHPIRQNRSAICLVVKENGKICGEPAVSLDMCGSHYHRNRRHGDPLGGGAPRGASAARRFWMKINLNGPIPLHATELGPCWVWTASMVGAGYGSFKPGGGSHAYAHRWAWEQMRGPIPGGLVLDHLCWNPSCVRPSHLDPVTHRENVLRGMGASARNARKTHCPRGHEYTPHNTYINSHTGGRACRTCALEANRLWQDRMQTLRVA